MDRITRRARPGFEPGTSRTRSENHTPRPTSPVSYSLSRPTRLFEAQVTFLTTPNSAINGGQLQATLLRKVFIAWIRCGTRLMHAQKEHFPNYIRNCLAPKSFRSLTVQKAFGSLVAWRARPAFEPGTSRTLSENHTPRPTSPVYPVISTLTKLLEALLACLKMSEMIQVMEKGGSI